MKAMTFVNRLFLLLMQRCFRGLPPSDKPKDSAVLVRAQWYGCPHVARRRGLVDMLDNAIQSRRGLLSFFAGPVDIRLVAHNYFLPFDIG